MEKIEREVRPQQGEYLDYHIWSLQEIRTKVGEYIQEKAYRDGCHIYLWVTHRFLPDALRMFEAWGVRYQCQLTWRKNVGITPYSWMYDTEHVLFGRIGGLSLSENGLRLSFDAAVTRHSSKPQVFYDRVCAASPGPRLALFEREWHEGFVCWGNEVVNESAPTL
jgi:N6-adenosine-specific RNA methylase IME4